MNTVDIIVRGTVLFCACHTLTEDEDDEMDLDYEMIDLLKPDTVEVNGVVYKPDSWGSLHSNFWKDLMEGYDFPLRLWAPDFNETYVYKLQLQDDEEFDIGKLKFIFSCEFEPYEEFAYAARIWYDGRLVDAEDDDGHYYPSLGSGHAAVWDFEEFDDTWPDDDPLLIKVVGI